jgi:hypothetical protein
MSKWWVAEDGYKWLSEDGKVLSPESIRPREEEEEQTCWPTCRLVPVSQEYTSYELRKHPELFRTFAETPRTATGFLAFAKQYGNLGRELLDEEWMLDVDPSLVDGPPLPRRFDPIWLWDTAIEEMDRWVTLWDGAPRGQAREDALAAILDAVNDKLFQDVDQEAFQVRFAKDRLNPRVYALEVTPTNLLTALWFQLGHAVAENKRFRRCAKCQKWFEVTPPVNRKSRHYCSDACRSRAYRSRKDRARQMAATGKSVKKIAKDLDSTVETVKGWLAQEREE